MIAIIGFASPALSSGKEDADHFSAIRIRLIGEGFEKSWIDALYNNESVYFEKKGVSLFFMHNEAELNYGQFTRSKNIKLARKYMATHRDTLLAAQENYGVDPEVITAIILVETRFGAYVGRRSILNTLSTISAMSESGPREAVWEQIPEARRIPRTAFDNKADARSKWAYNELKAFLTYANDHGMNPIGINGSYAGAMGIAQFMPSNVIRLAKDGNHDGRINLFEHEDAIHSIASYLEHYGWRKGINRIDAAKVVYHYNHSDYYVDTILKISDLLKG